MDTGRLLHRILIRVQDFILLHPIRVLAVSAAGLVAAVSLGLGVEFRTSRADLAPRDDPDQQRLEEVATEFRGLADLIAAVEAAPGESKSPGELRAFADRLADRFRADPGVSQVFHKVDLDWLTTRGLWLLPADEIHRALVALRTEQATLESLGSTASLAGLNALLARRLETGLDTTDPPPEEEALAGLEAMLGLLDWEREFLEAPGTVLDRLEQGPPLLHLAGDRPELASGGYLSTVDGSILFMMVSPRDDDDSLPALQRFVGSLRSAAEEVRQAHPGFRVAFTGEPAMTVEEMGAVRTDTWLTAAFAATGVILLTLFVFRWRAHAVIVLVALGAGVLWALGAVKLELGYLNLITSSFVSTLIGVGVAYAIHPVSEYELEGAHTKDPLGAVRGAYHATGAAVTTGGITTAGAFFSILLMRFRGFSELGLVAGVGILLCLIAALVTLPALLVVYARWRHARDRATHHKPAVVDRIWVERGAGMVCASPRAATAAALLITVAMAWAATGVRFDTSMTNLLPRDAESVKYLVRMIEDSDLSPNMNIVLAGDLEELRRARDLAGREETISRFDSALQFLPEDPEGSRSALSELSAILEGVRLPEAPRPSGRQELAASFRRLETAFADAADAAFSAGRGGLAGPLEEARERAERLEALVGGAPAGAAERWASGEERLLVWAGRALGDLKAAAAAAPPTAERLPPAMRDRFVTRSGRFVALLHSAENIFDREYLDEFVAASRRVAADVTGFPVVFRTMSNRITSGFYRAASVAVVVVFLILLADFRNLRETALALVPLGMGIVWMMGGMRLLGISYNFANLVAIPLIIGVGIDNGVHIIHRIRLEGERGMTVVLRHTGRAILIASLTTMIGFGSLSLASHRGMASLGMILLLGVASCLVSSMVVLPNILVAFGRVKE